MGDRDIHYAEVLCAAETFLRRFRDAFTAANRDDLAQEAAIETWRRSATLRDPECAAAFARTVARRLRYHALNRAHRSAIPVGGDPDLLLDPREVVQQTGEAERAFCVDGEWIEAQWFERQIDSVLCALGPVNGRLVRDFYAGSSCAELGVRYGLPAKGVKARLHRSRLRIRETFVARARSAGIHRGSVDLADRPTTRTEGEVT